MPKKSEPQQLLVEGKNDQHVIWGLCQQYQLPELFSVKVAAEKSTEGIDAILSILPTKLKEGNLKTLVIVVDADDDLAARWQSLTNKLRESGYHDIPSIPPPEGWVYQPTDPYLPRVGIWIMPNNQLPGMLEDFVAALIPADDALKPKADEILR